MTVMSVIIRDQAPFWQVKKIIKLNIKNTVFVESF